MQEVFEEIDKLFTDFTQTCNGDKVNKYNMQALFTNTANIVHQYLQEEKDTDSKE